MKLTGRQRKQLQSALIEAFPNATSLEMMLDHELERNFRAIAGEGSLQEIVFKLIQTAEAQGWVEDLVRAGRQSNSGNLLLRDIAQELLTPSPAPDTVMRDNSVILKTAKDDLENILKAINNFNIVRNACRRSLPRLAQHYALSINQIDEVFILLLEEFPYRNDGKLRILEFAWRLHEHLSVQRQQIHFKLDDWFRRYGFEPPNVSDTNPNVSDTDLKKIPQPRLFIQVTPKHSESDQFFVQAWLIPDQYCSLSDINIMNKYYVENEYFYLDFSYLFCNFGDEVSEFVSQNLWVKMQQLKRENSLQNQKNCSEIKYIRDFSFSKEELRELLELFLNESLLILLHEEEEVNKDIKGKRLTIELFLPSDLLCDCDVDQWLFSDLAEEDSSGELGSLYQVFIRSLERSKWLQSTDSANARRLRKNAKKKESWQFKWKLVQSILKEGKIPSYLEFELLSYVNDFDKASLSVQLDEKIGVKLVQGSQKDEILRVIIEEKSIPIVLWTRCDNSEIDFANELNELVHKEPLHKLPQSVLKVRKAARESGSKNHLGCHLVLLWDDPNCCPPPEGDFLQIDIRTRSK